MIITCMNPSSFIWIPLVTFCCYSSPVIAAQPNENLITPEFTALLRSGDSARIRDAIDHGSPVNARDLAGNTPLMSAAVYGNASFLRLLLDRGAQVNVTNAAAATPLMRAVADYEKVRLLVDR